MPKNHCMVFVWFCRPAKSGSRKPLSGPRVMVPVPCAGQYKVMEIAMISHRFGLLVLPHLHLRPSFIILVSLSMVVSSGTYIGCQVISLFHPDVKPSHSGRACANAGTTFAPP